MAPKNTSDVPFWVGALISYTYKGFCTSGKYIQRSRHLLTTTHSSHRPGLVGHKVHGGVEALLARRRELEGEKRVTLLLNSFK